MVYGVDLAKSYDWTWVIGMNAQGGVCFSERWQSDWRQTTERIAGIMKNTPAYIDSTGVGDPIVEDLQRRCPLIEGYKFTSQSKQQLMEGLATSFQKREISFGDEVLKNELETFQFEYTKSGVRYTAPEGLHDDGVCSLALARAKLFGRPDVLPFSINGATKPIKPVVKHDLMEVGWQ
jgi:hypothetical protein